MFSPGIVANFPRALTLDGMFYQFNFFFKSQFRFVIGVKTSFKFIFQNAKAFVCIGVCLYSLLFHICKNAEY